MTVRIAKQPINLRERLSELERPIGVKGNELMRAETAQDARDLVSAGRKNLIINGNFDVWQRGTSFLNNNTIRYTADRWQVYGVSTSVLDITRQAFTAGQTEVEGNPKYYIRLDNTPDVDNTWIELFQRIEDVTYFSNITVTLSFWIKSNRSFTNNNYFKFKQNFGSGGSSEVSTDSSNFDISTSWEKKTLTVTLPSVSGKTIGDNNYLEVHLLQNSSVQADTHYDIAQFQLEVGKNATEFEHRSYGEELALCQRYYKRITGAGGGFRAAIGQSPSSDQLRIPSQNLVSVPLRAIPTFGYSASGVTLIEGNSQASISSAAFQNNATTGDWNLTLYTSGSTIASGDLAAIRLADTSSWIDFNAEL